MGFIGGFRAVGSTRSVRRYPAFIEDIDSLVGADFVRRDGTNTMTGATWDTGGITDFTNIQKMIIGSLIDLGPVLQVEGAVGQQIEVRDGAVDGDNKLGSLTVTHRSNDTEEPGALIAGSMEAASNVVFIGGGNAAYNAATEIRGYAAPNNTTTVGTRMTHLTTAGFKVQSGVVGAALGLFHVQSDVGPAIVARQSDGRVTIGNSTVPGAELLIDQFDDTAAIPVVTLNQEDVSEEMMELLCTIGVGNAIEAVAAKVLTPTHFVKVTLTGGLTRYFEVGTIA